MPGYTTSAKKVYVRSLDKWVNKKTETSFDYDEVNKDSTAMLVNFFRWYPDLFCDIFRDENAKYKLELPQRMIMRIFARYRNTYITGVRGLTKTYLAILSSLVEGILFPGHKVRYCAPNQKQAAQLARAAFREIEKSYPIITGMWNVNNERPDMFRCSTIYGSEVSMYSVRGDTAAACLGEECGQEGENAFPIDEFLKDIYPVIRDNRMINQKIDNIHINQKHQHIGNACSRTNKAYTDLRASCLKDMLTDKNPYEGYVLDVSWVTALLGGIRDIKYFKDLKKTLTPEDWLRECCAIYTGIGENPMVSDEDLSRSRLRLKCMEDKHCGDETVIYVVSQDVSYEDGKKNAKIGRVVGKLTPFKSIEKRDKLRAQIVYVDGFAPQGTVYQQANELKECWQKYWLNGAEPTYLVIDFQGGYGRAIGEELMKKPINGGKSLCCYKHLMLTELEQPYALPVIYPMKSGRIGTANPEAEMIDYARREFMDGNVELLTADRLDGLQKYKDLHGIKDINGDGRIIAPYTKTNELCEEIMNLQAVNGKESRRSKYINRDKWSALKYLLWFKHLLEEEMVQKNHKAKSSWDSEIKRFEQSGQLTKPTQMGGDRSRLIGLRTRTTRR